MSHFTFQDFLRTTLIGSHKTVHTLYMQAHYTFIFPSTLLIRTDSLSHPFISPCYLTCMHWFGSDQLAFLHECVWYCSP